MTMVITQYDSIIPSTIPADAQAVAGYVGGRWPDYSELVRLFPHALHKSIAVSADEDADILDIESGDAIPAQAPAWVRRQKARGADVVGLYSDEAQMGDVMAAMTAAGISPSEYVRWEAWLGAPTIPVGMHARQYTFTALGRNLDASICLPSFWGTRTRAVNVVRYDNFERGSFLINGLHLSERAVVKRYDRLRAKQTGSNHPYRTRLALLRKWLAWLAGRVYTVANDQPRPDGRPSWNVDHRGYRYQQLHHRSLGQRFV